jgi:hypothetical protein
VALELVTTLERFRLLGYLQIEGEAAVGEWTLDHSFSVRPGTWRAWLLEEDALDDLVDAGLAAEDACQQLVLIHDSSEAPASVTLPPMSQIADVPIEAASFTIACASMRTALDGMDGFYEHLDGVHGVIANGRGAHVKLSGDGKGIVWTTREADLVLVELM